MRHYIMDIYRASQEWGVAPKDMMGTGFLVRTLERESEQRRAVVHASD